MAEFYRFLKSRAYMMRHSLFFSAHILIPLAGILLISGIYGNPAGEWLGTFDFLCDTFSHGLSCRHRNRDGHAYGQRGESRAYAESSGGAQPCKNLVFRAAAVSAARFSRGGNRAVWLSGSAYPQRGSHGAGDQGPFFTHICALGIECACLCHSFIFRISFWRRGYHRCRCGGIRHLSRHADRSWGRCLVCVVAILRNALFYSAACLETGGRREFAASDPSWGNLLSYGFCVILGHDIYLVSEI